MIAKWTKAEEAKSLGLLGNAVEVFPTGHTGHATRYCYKSDKRL